MLPGRGSTRMHSVKCGLRQDRTLGFHRAGNALSLRQMLPSPVRGDTILFRLPVPSVTSGFFVSRLGSDSIVFVETNTAGFETQCRYWPASSKLRIFVQFQIFIAQDWKAKSLLPSLNCCKFVNNCLDISCVFAFSGEFCLDTCSWKKEPILLI